MKKSKLKIIALIVASVSFVFPCSLYAQNILFKITNCDFGSINSGDTVICNFGFTVATAPVSIFNVTSNCECIKVDWPTEVLQVGYHGKIIISYRPSDDFGPQSKEIEISYN